MNGVLTATYQARVTRSTTSISLRNGTTVNWTKGDEVDVREDHYGNTYVLIDGNDESLFDCERIGDTTWHAAGLQAKVEECDRILDRHAGPDGNADVRERYTAQRVHAVNRLSEFAETET